MLDINPGHCNARQQQAGHGNGIANEVAEGQGQQGGGQVEQCTPPPIVVVLVFIPIVAAMVIVLLYHILRFTGDGSSGGIVVPEGVTIAGVTSGHRAGVLVAVGLSGRRGGGGDGAAPGGRLQRENVLPPPAPANCPPPRL